MADTTKIDQIAALELEIAKEDLVALQAFVAVATNLATTIAELETASTTLVAAIQDPDRLAECTSMTGLFSSCFGELATIAAKCNAAAGG